MGIQPLADIMVRFVLKVVDGEFENGVVTLEDFILEGIKDGEFTHRLVMEGICLRD